MSETVAPISIEILETSKETGEATVVGRGEYGPGGKVKLLAAREPHLEPLARAFQALNGKPTLPVEVPPEPGSPKFAVATRDVARDDEDFFEALQTYFKKYYGFDLEEATPSAAA
jgi:hypothetical protein